MVSQKRHQERLVSVKNQQISHSHSTQRCEHIHPNEAVDRVTNDTEDQNARIMLMEKFLSEPEEVKMDQVTGGAPMLQDYSSYAIPLQPSPTCFRSITTGNRSPIRWTKNRAPKKGVKKDREVKRKNSTCVLSNHVFQCRSKVEARIKHSDYLPPSSQNLPRY